MSATKLRATIAAWDWVGAYEGHDELLDRTLTLDDAFELCGTPGRVRRRFPDAFPEDLIDAYAMLRRSAKGQARAAGKVIS